MTTSSSIEKIIGWLEHEGANEPFIALVFEHRGKIFDGGYDRGLVYLNFKSTTFANEFLSVTKGERGRGTLCAASREDPATIIVSAGV